MKSIPSNRSIDQSIHLIDDFGLIVPERLRLLRLLRLRLHRPSVLPLRVDVEAGAFLEDDEKEDEGVGDGCGLGNINCFENQMKHQNVGLPARPESRMK